MKRVYALLAGLAALSLWGCGGGGGGQNTNALTIGRSQLNKLAAGEQPTTTQNLQSALDLFLQAVRNDPASPEANFGAAVCMTGVVAMEADGVTASTVITPSGTSGQGGGSSSGPPAPSGGATSPDDGVIPPAPPDHPQPVRPIPAHHFLGLLWNLDRGLSNPYVLLHMLAPLNDLRFGMLGYYGEDPDFVTRRQQMLAKLNTVVDYLAKVEADPNFTTTLPLPHRNGKFVTVGLPEVYLFDAYVNSMRAEIALSLAYIRDTGDWQPPVPPVMIMGSSVTTMIYPMPPIIWPDPDKDGKLTPNEYLPPSPFLTLRNPKLLTTAQQAMLAVADRAAKGIAGVLARSADADFLIPNTPEISAALTEVRDHVLPLIQQAATGPVTLEIPHPVPLPMMTMQALSAASHGMAAGMQPMPMDGPPSIPGDNPLPQPVMEKITLNLAAWFATPPPDLKVFAPTIPLGEDGWPQFDKAVYPDPTFGGLFPDGLPTGGWF
jgi:hypothetical protein